MSINEQVIQKLQKILARADVNRGATQNEVEIAMQKAQALALEHNIDLSTVSVDGEVKVNAIETDSTAVNISTKYERTYHAEILNVLGWCFDVRHITSSYWTHQAQRVITKITFVGEKTDVVIATYVWNYLQTLFPKCWSEYRKQHSAAGWTSERSFYKGLAIGIWSNNKRQKDSLSLQPMQTVTRLWSWTRQQLCKRRLLRCSRIWVRSSATRSSKTHMPTHRATHVAPRSSFRAA